MFLTTTASIARPLKTSSQTSQDLMVQALDPVASTHFRAQVVTSFARKFMSLTAHGWCFTTHKIQQQIRQHSTNSGDNI